MLRTVSSMDRKEGDGQEQIQLPNTFRSKTPKGKKDAVKVTAQQSKHHKQKAKRTASSKKKKKKKNSQMAIQNKNHTKTHTQRHITTEPANHSRSTAPERPAKTPLGVGANRPHAAGTLAPGPPRHTQDTRCPREGLQTLFANLVTTYDLHPILPQWIICSVLPKRPFVDLFCANFKIIP